MESIYGAPRSRAGEGWGPWGVIPGCWCLGKKEAGEALWAVWERQDTGLEVSTQGEVPGWLQVLQLLLLSQECSTIRQDHDRVESHTSSVIPQNSTFPPHLVPVKIPIPRYASPDGSPIPCLSQALI